jgi:hypothetical protein
MNDQSRLNLHEAARRLAPDAIHEAEVAIAHAIEHGELAANVKRWATEQWEGQQLPGNLNRLETWIAPAELARWAASR